MCNALLLDDFFKVGEEVIQAANDQSSTKGERGEHVHDRHVKCPRGRAKETVSTREGIDAAVLIE